MDSLISRQAAIDEIEERKNANGYRNVAVISELNRLEGYIMRLPSAQPEVIHCKDCKHQVKEWRTDKRLKDNGYTVCGCDVVSDACGYWALLGQDDDYCSMAERRTDDGQEPYHKAVGRTDGRRNNASNGL